MRYGVSAMNFKTYFDAVQRTLSQPSQVRSERRCFMHSSHKIIKFQGRIDPENVLKSMKVEWKWPNLWNEQQLTATELTAWPFYTELIMNEWMNEFYTRVRWLLASYSKSIQYSPLYTCFSHSLFTCRLCLAIDCVYK